MSCWAISSTGGWGLLDPLWPPAYMFWKLTLLFSPSDTRRMNG
jgi:hypothetical protein